MLWAMCLCRPWTRTATTNIARQRQDGCDACHRPTFTHPGLHGFPLCFIRVSNGELPYIAPEIDFDGDRKAHGCWSRLKKRYHLIHRVFFVSAMKIYVPPSASLFLVYMAVWAAHTPPQPRHVLAGRSAQPPIRILHLFMLAWYAHAT